MGQLPVKLTIIQAIQSNLCCAYITTIIVVSSVSNTFIWTDPTYKACISLLTFAMASSLAIAGIATA
jgi:hypothetical protein